MRHPSSPLLFPILTILFLLLLLTIPTHAANTPTSYCKCICFTNSTIIPLNSPPDTTTSSSRPRDLHLRDQDKDDSNGGKKHHTLTCNDCNRAFCLDYNLPICKNAKEEDVFATCFQRDSLKDRTVVTLFLVATAGLLGWALIKPFVVTPTTTELAQKYGDRIGVGLGVGVVDGEDGALPGSGRGAGSGSGSGSSSRGGFGRDVRVGDDERPRSMAGGRGSISRQGGLNS